MTPFPDKHRTIVDILVDFGERQPDRVFCHLYRENRDAVVITYGGLLAQGLRFAALYRRHGAMPGDTVTIVLRTGADLIHGFAGALLGGFVPSYAAPLGDRQQPSHYWDQLQLQLHRIEDSLLLADGEFSAAVLQAVGSNRLRLILAEEAAAIAEAAPIFQPAPDDVAFIQHSSGTTGGRKGVALSHRSLLDQLASYGAALGLRETDVIVSWLPLYHDMGLISSFLLPMLTGTPLVLIDPFEWVAAPWLLLERINRHRGTLVWLPNFAFHLLARVRPPESAAIDLSSVRAFINCSEPCKAEAFDLFHQRFAALGVAREALQICYAMAETVFAVTQTRLNAPVMPRLVSRAGLQEGRLRLASAEDDAMKLMPVGTPVDGVRLKIADEEGRDLPEGAVGEVLISADYMFSGYYREPDLTEAALTGEFYRSGDLGGFLEGELHITGRKKDVIIVNGKNFYAHDIEAAVNGVDKVKAGRCVAFGLENLLVGSEAVCILAETEAPAEDHAMIGRAIKEAVLGHLGLLVGKVVMVPPKTLIKTTSGKISRRENKARFVSGQF